MLSAMIRSVRRRLYLEKLITKLYPQCQPALKASYYVYSKLILNGVNFLNKLGLQNKVTLVWVPGHTGVQGNENADELARAGSARKMIGLEPSIRIRNAV